MIDDDDIMTKISNEFMSTKTKVVIIRFSEAVKQIRHRHQPGENYCALNFNQSAKSAYYSELSAQDANKKEKEYSVVLKSANASLTTLVFLHRST